jgi:hypothetical protein
MIDSDHGILQLDDSYYEQIEVEACRLQTEPDPAMFADDRTAPDLVIEPLPRARAARGTVEIDDEITEVSKRP